MMGLSGLQLHVRHRRRGEQSARSRSAPARCVTIEGSKRTRREEGSMPELKRFIRLCVATAVGLVVSAGLVSTQAQAQERELKVGYMKNPIQDASLDIMDKWAKAHGVKLTRVPMAYSVFMEKVTATLTGGTDQFDVIWHNDDWGQLWEKYLETTDDVKGIENVDQWPLLAFWNHEHKLTVVPMAHTVGTFFYRTDLLKSEEVPTTFAQLVSTSQRLQKEGKVK